MPKEYSPFTPGQPVPIEFFVGRQAEVERLRQKVAAAATGRLEIAFLSGERGIGKSSVASFVRHLVERDLKVLGLHTFLGGVTTLSEMVRRIFERLIKASVEKAWYSKIKEFFGSHIRQVGLFGASLEFQASDRDLQRLVHDFAPALRRLTQKLQDEKKGILLVLDDINGLAGSADFANWLKSLIDEIATTAEPLPLCLILAGLDERRHSLVSLQPSLARVFDLIEIQAWKQNETEGFFRNAFAKVDVAIEYGALRMLTRFAGGLPVLAHEIGDAVFKADGDNRIDLDDAKKGVFNAAEIVGRKHLEPQVFRAIRSPRYRTILRKMAGEPSPSRFQRGQVLKRLKQEEIKVFDNFLRRMKDLGVISPDPEKGPGSYRFANILHFLYFRLEAQAAGVSKPDAQ